MVVCGLALNEKQLQNKHVESSEIPCLDAGSTPAGSTKKQKQAERLAFVFEFILILLPILILKCPPTLRTHYLRSNQFHMTETIIAAGAGILGTIVGGIITFLIQREQLKNELQKIRLENRTEFQAEQTALHFLSHAGYTDRSFETLKNHLGGFDDDELRRILVRAGAIRTFREDGSEWWRLLSRMDEYIAKRKADV